MKDALKAILVLINQTLQQLGYLIEDQDRLEQYLRSLGWQPDIVLPSVFSNALAIADDIETIKGLIDQLENRDSNALAIVEQAIPLVKSLMTTIKALTSKNPATFSIFPLNQALFWSELGSTMFDNLLIGYLQRDHEIIFSILLFTGVIDMEQVTPTQPRRIPYTKRTFAWDKLGQLFTQPQNLFKTKYNWTPNNVNYDELFFNLSYIFNLFGLQSRVNTLSHEVYSNFYSGLSLSPTHNLKELDLPIFRYVGSGNNFQNFGLSLSPGANAGQVDGLLLVPEIIGLIELIFRPSPDSLIKIEGYFNANNIIGLQFLTNGTCKLVYNGPSNLIIGSKVTYAFAPAYPKLLLGSETSSGRLYLNGYELSVEVKGELADPELILRVGMGDIVTQPNFIFVYDPAANDNFIRKILGDELLDITFGMGVRWSSKHGIGFEGEVGFSKEISLHNDQKNKEGSFLKIPAFRIAVKGGTNGANLSLGVDIDLDISVIKASVRDIGVKISLNKVSGSQGGLLNNLDLDFDFKWPSGVGIAISAPPVSGGGFLNYDDTTSTYTGGLELNFSKISFTAIGIVSTKLPGNQPGYSLLIIITAEFGPLPLGMGFTLNGLGGILGLNRTMNPDVLRTGIRNNSLDSILFPKDIVKNANTIISNIGQAFPAKEGQFLVGPMAKIGWGTPTLLTIELGIIIELPEPVRLAILGVVKALLPSKDNAIVKIQVNFLGIIDFTNKYLSFDASLYDSQILTFELFGDMALRLYWGDKPNFLLSVGGFHPKFTPPPLNLPELRRLTIVLANQNNLKISVETYFAVTSNSVQFGARVAAMAKAWKIQAIGALWFDILFQFSPFYFIADMGVMFAIKMGSKTLLSLFVELSLEGPNPWRAKGKGSFKVLFVKVTVSFDKTFGQARVEAIQAVTVDDKLKAALTSPDNWEALMPQRSNQMIAWREEAPNEDMSVDPGGALKISQRLLPLQVTLQKFGTSAISDNKRYDILSITADNVNMDYQVVKDYFARNEFFYMTDDEKLSRDSYELFDCGVVAGSGRLTAEYALHKKCDFEEITLDAGYRRKELNRFVLAGQLFELQRFGNYISRSSLSSFERITTNKGPNSVKVSLDEGDFVLVNRNDLVPVPSLGSFTNSAEAERFLAENIAAAPAMAAEWIVANKFELAFN